MSCLNGAAGARAHADGGAAMRAITQLASALVLTVTVVPSLAGTADAGAHRVRIEGQGSVTVVFEAGLGDTLDVWRRVQSQVSSSCARTVSYNRAGYPGSKAVDADRSAAQIVEELRAELGDRGIAPPYVLVGHSLGGLYVQYFVRNHPGEVAGVVLVDSTHWDQLERIRREAPATYGTLRLASLLMFGTMRKEFADSGRSGEQVRGIPANKSPPTVVLSSTRAAPGELPQFRALMRRLQNEIAAEYGAERHTFVSGSGHYIQRDRPEAVIEAIHEVAGCDG